MATPRFISDLVGTMQTYLRINSLRLKNNSGALNVRDSADTVYADTAMATLFLQGATSGAVGLKGDTNAGAVTYTLPNTDGSTGDALVTDGAGVLSFTPVATGANMVKSQVENVAFNSGSPITIFTPPANATLLRVIVDVDTAFDASGPTANLSVGIVGTTSKYMGATDNDLTAVGTYEVAPNYQEDGTPDVVIITFSAGAGGANGSANVMVEYANPA